jgi:hypothetical protein
MDTALSIEHAAAATDVEAAAILADVFDEPGDYVLAGPGGLYGIRLSAPAIAARDPMALWQELFAADGEYVIRKARAVDPDPTEEVVHTPKRIPRWWIEALLSDAEQHALTLRGTFVEKMTELVAKHAGALADPEAIVALEQILMDFRLAVKWSLGLPLPPAIEGRLRALGFTTDEVLRFPGMAYRLGMIESELAKRPHMPLKDILRIARAVPLNPADEVAIKHATARAGEALSPVLVRDAQRTMAEALEHERGLTRTLTARGIEREWSTREFSRQLRETLSPEGVVRDFDRVARTEMQESRIRGAFAADMKARDWKPSTQVFRTVAAVPCNQCLTLYKDETGMPRLYTVEALEAEDARGYNRGRPYHARVGVTHPNCLCSPWVKWWPEMKAIYEPERAKWLATYKRRGIGG